MADQSLFEDGQVTSQDTPVQQPVNQGSLFADQLAAIKDENGRQKYDTPDKALEALKHSQAYIPQLKSQVTEYEGEIARLKAELEKTKSVEDIVSRLTQQTEGHPPVNQQFDESAVEALLERKLQQTELANKKVANLQLVESQLVSKFGEGARAALSAKATELGISLAQLRAMSEESPQVVSALFSTTKQPTPSITGGGLPLPPVNQQDSLENRIKDAERKVTMSGINHATRDLVSQLRRENMAKHGLE